MTTPQYHELGPDPLPSEITFFGTESEIRNKLEHAKSDVQVADLLVAQDAMREQRFDEIASLGAAEKSTLETIQRIRTAIVRRGGDPNPPTTS